MLFVFRLQSLHFKVLSSSYLNLQKPHHIWDQTYLFLICTYIDLEFLFYGSYAACISYCWCVIEIHGFHTFTVWKDKVLLFEVLQINLWQALKWRKEWRRSREGFLLSACFCWLCFKILLPPRVTNCILHACIHSLKLCLKDPVLIQKMNMTEIQD